MVDWATVLVSVGGSLITSIGIVEYRLYRKQSVEDSAELEEWYSDSAGYAAEVRRIWNRLFDSAEQPSTNLSEISSQLSLLERQISRHASDGEQLGADEKVVESLDNLAAECRKPAEHSIHMNSFSEFKQFRKDILAAVEKVEEALNQRESSPIVQALPNFRPD